MAKKKNIKEEEEVLLGAPTTPLFKIQFSTNKVVWKFASDEQAKIVAKSDDSEYVTYEIEPALSTFIPYAKRGSHVIYLRIAMSEDNGITYTYSEPQEFNVIYGMSYVKSESSVDNFTREELTSILANAKAKSIYHKSYADMHGIKSPLYFLLKDTNDLGYSEGSTMVDRLPIDRMNYRKAINDNFDFNSLVPHTGLARRYDIQFLLACNSVVGSIYDSDQVEWGGGKYPHVVTELFKTKSGSNLYFFNTSNAFSTYKPTSSGAFDNDKLNTALDSRFLTFTDRKPLETAEEMKTAKYRSSMLFDLGRIKSLGYFLGAHNAKDSYALPNAFLAGSEKLKPFYDFNMANVNPLVYTPDTKDNAIAIKSYSFSSRGYKDGVNRGAFYDKTSTPYKEQISSMVLSDFAWRAFTDVHLMNNGYSLNTLMYRNAQVETRVFHKNGASVGVPTPMPESENSYVVKQGHAGVFVKYQLTDSESSVMEERGQNYGKYSPIYKAARDWNYERDPLTNDKFKVSDELDTTGSISHFEAVYRNAISPLERMILAKKYSMRHVEKDHVYPSIQRQNIYRPDTNAELLNITERISIVPTEVPLMYLNDHKCGYSILRKVGEGRLISTPMRANLVPTSFNSMVKSFHVEPIDGSLDRFDVMIDDSYNVMNFLSMGASDKMTIQHNFRLRAINGDVTSSAGEGDYISSVAMPSVSFNLHLNEVHNFNEEYAEGRNLLDEPTTKFRFRDTEGANFDIDDAFRPVPAHVEMFTRIIDDWEMKNPDTLPAIPQPEPGDDFLTSDDSWYDRREHAGDVPRRPRRARSLSSNEEVTYGVKVSEFSNNARFERIHRKYEDAIFGLCAETFGTTSDGKAYDLTDNYDTTFYGLNNMYKTQEGKFSGYGEVSDGLIKSQLLPYASYGSGLAMQDYKVVFPKGSRFLGEIKREERSLTTLCIGDDGNGGNDFPEDTYLSAKRTRRTGERN